MEIFRRIEKFNLPVVRVEEVIACKTAYNRPKDLQDIKLIKDYLESIK